MEFSPNKLKSFLQRTIFEAKKTLSEGNYPIGSIVVDSNGEIVASCGNENRSLDDITAHAEILCLRKLGANFLSKDSPKKLYLFSSLEPCGGCGLFIARTNIKAICSASNDPYKPAVSVLAKLPQYSSFFTDLEIIHNQFPELMKESRRLMKDYFIERGNNKAASYYDMG